MSARAVGIDVGTSHVKLVVLSGGRGRVRLEARASTPIPPAGQAEERRTAMLRGLRELVGQYQLRSVPAIAAISGSKSFVRVVRPILSARRDVSQALRFEAEHVIPFALDEVSWDFQLFDSGASRRTTDALLVAVKREFTDALSALAAEADLDLRAVDITPLAIFNAAVQAEVVPRKQYVALVSIGTDASDLVLCRDGRVWVRSFPIGGGQMVARVAEALGVAPEDAMRAMVGAEGGGRAPDAVVRALEPAWVELATELRRSLEYRQFQLQQLAAGQTAGQEAAAGATLTALAVQGREHEQPRAADPVDAVWLSGGGAAIAGLAEFLGGQLGCVVRVFNPLERLSGASPAAGRAAGSPPPAFDVATGLALRGLGRCPAEINLIRSAVVQRETSRQRRAALAVGYAGLVVSLVVLGVGYYHRFSARKAEYEAVDNRLRIYREYAGPAEGLERTNEALGARTRVLLRAVQRRAVWLTLLSELDRVMPDGVWVTSITTAPLRLDVPSPTPEPPATLPTERRGRLPVPVGRQEIRAAPQPETATIQGVAPSFKQINTLLTRLKESPMIADVHSLSSSVQAQTDRPGEVVEFTIEVLLAPET